MTTHTLPQGWKATTLGAEFKWSSGGTPKSGTPAYYENGSIHWLNISDLNDGLINCAERQITELGLKESSAKMVKEGSVLIAIYGSIGKLGINTIPLATNQAICFTQHIPEHILNKFLFYYLLSIRNKLISLGKGGTQQNISQTVLKTIPFAYPNKPTQTAIVQKIETLFADIDAGIASLKNAQMQLKQYRQSLLKNAFNGELTKQWREQNAEHLPSENELLAQIQTAREAHHEKQLADWQNAVKEWEQAGKIGKKPSKPKAQTQAVQFEENLDELPNGWGDFLLDNLAEISGGLTKNSKRNTFVEKAPYLRVANVYANELKLDEIETIGIQESEKARTLLQENDLLIVEGNGSIEQIGRVALWNGSINPCYHQNHLIKARCYPFALPKFVLYFLMSPIGRQGIINVASSTTGLHTLSLTKVANLIVPICSLAEQTQIVAILEQKLTACDALATELTNQLKQAELLKQAVLKSAFSGSLLDNTAQ